MRKQQYISFFLGLIALLLVPACANIIQPTGGPKDTTPPRLIRNQSTPNKQINFEKQTIVLTFDEWLKLNNPVTQVVISPPLVYKHEVSLKKRSVRFKFDDREVLKEGATYTINFGEAVQDLNEGNPAKDLRFVFATGPYIDSLQVSGELKDALTGEPAAEMLLMLYDNLADSVLRTEKPFYFAKTDKTGKFRIENVKSDTFKVCALKDINLNYIYDQATEEIGFLEDPIFVVDSIQPKLSVLAFQEVPPLRLKSKNVKRYGLVRLEFNQSPRQVQVSTQNAERRTELLEYEGDSLRLWYSGTDTSNWDIYLQKDTLFYDTITVKSLDRAAFLAKDTLRLSRPFSGTSSDFNPGKPLRLTFNHPIIELDTSLIRVYEDSLRLPIIVNTSIDSVEKQVVKIDFKWKAGMVYALEMLPDAVKDIYDLTSDSLFHNYNALTKDAFGNMSIKINQLDTNYYYVLQLLFKGENLVKELYFGKDSTYQTSFSTLPPGEYSLKIIEDRNGNRRWDTGNYDLKQQPEIILSKKLEELRANWEVEVDISMQELKQQQSNKRE